jgi:hypothetical protein
VFLGLESI